LDTPSYMARFFSVQSPPVAIPRNSCLLLAFEPTSLSQEGMFTTCGHAEA